MKIKFKISGSSIFSGWTEIDVECNDNYNEDNIVDEIIKYTNNYLGVNNVRSRNNVIWEHLDTLSSAA